MDSLIHADIFFFITTIAVVIISIGLIVGLVFVILILNNVRKISETVRSESGLLAEDVHVLRAKVRGGNLNLASVFYLFRKLFMRHKKSIDYKD